MTDSGAPPLTLGSRALHPQGTLQNRAIVQNSPEAAIVMEREAGVRAIERLVLEIRGSRWRSGKSFTMAKAQV